MAAHYNSLRDFINFLEQKGQLRRISAPVSPKLEFTAIGDQLIENGPAVLCENVMGTNGKKYAMPALLNLFGTMERVAWALARLATWRCKGAKLNRPVGWSNRTKRALHGHGGQRFVRRLSTVAFSGRLAGI